MAVTAVDTPEIVERVMGALMVGWERLGPLHMPRVVRLHPTDRDDFAAWLRVTPRHWGHAIPREGDIAVETDLGDVTVRADETVAPGGIAITEA